MPRRRGAGKAHELEGLHEEVLAVRLHLALMRQMSHGFCGWEGDAQCGKASFCTRTGLGLSSANLTASSTTSMTSFSMSLICPSDSRPASIMYFFSCGMGSRACNHPPAPRSVDISTPTYPCTKSLKSLKDACMLPPQLPIMAIQPHIAPKTLVQLELGAEWPSPLPLILASGQEAYIRYAPIYISRWLVGLPGLHLVVLLLLLLSQLIRVGQGVAAEAVRLRLNQRRAVAAPRARNRLGRHLTHLNRQHHGVTCLAADLFVINCRAWHSAE